MGRPDASAERMVAVTKRYGLSVVLVLSALLVILLVRPETLVGPVFLPAVCSAPGSAGWGPAWSQTDHRLFLLAREVRSAVRPCRAA